MGKIEGGGDTKMEGGRDMEIVVEKCVTRFNVHKYEIYF